MFTVNYLLFLFPTQMCLPHCTMLVKRIHTGTGRSAAFMTGCAKLVILQSFSAWFSLFKTLNLCSYQSSLHSRKCLNKIIQLSICKTKNIPTQPLICPQHILVMPRICPYLILVMPTMCPHFIQDMSRICPTQHPQVKIFQLWT